MLALLIHDVTNPHNFGLIRGAEAQARAAGYTLVLGDTQQSPDLEATHAERLRSSVDGLMLAASRLPDAALAGLAGPDAAGAVQPGAGRVSQRGAWTPVDGSRQIIEHLARARSPALAYLAGSAVRLDRTTNGGGHCPVAEDLGRRDHPARTVPADPGQGVAAADVGLASGSARWSRSTTCWPSARCNGWSDAASRSRTRSAWSGSTTSSAPTSATRR